MKVQKVKAEASQVNKALSPEEQAIVANVKSLLEQLEQTAGADEMNVPPEPEGEVAMAAGESVDGEMLGDEDDEGDDVLKSEDASQPAKARIEEDPSETEEALTVLKAIMKMGGEVRKASRPVDPTLAALQGIAKALKGMSQRVDEQGQAIVGILEGIGVADQVATVQKSRRPVQSGGADASAVLKALMAAAQAPARDDPEPEGSLKDVLLGLTGRQQ
jgi:hypothetical protein